MGTSLTVEVSDTKKISRAAKIAIETSVAAARNCLQAETVLAGSSLNMAKSETVVYDDFVVHIRDGPQIKSSCFLAELLAFFGVFQGGG